VDLVTSEFLEQLMMIPRFGVCGTPYRHLHRWRHKRTALRITYTAIAAVHESIRGTVETCRRTLRMSVYGGAGSNRPTVKNDEIDRAPRGRELSVREGLTRIIVDWSGSWQANRAHFWTLTHARFDAINGHSPRSNLNSALCPP
jgi:hypothetical protein